MKEFYSTTEAALLLGISRVAVLKRIKKGTLPATRIGRNYGIAGYELTSNSERDDLLEFLKIL